MCFRQASFGQQGYATPRVMALAIWVASSISLTAPAMPSEIFGDASTATGLMHHPRESDGLRAAAVLIVHDALGMNARGLRYVDLLTRAGLIVLEMEIAANTLEGEIEPLPGEIEAASLVASAAAALAEDPRVDRRRLAAMGFGYGARALALASDREAAQNVFAALVLLYPGCGSLADLLQASEQPAATSAPPILLLHGENDPVNPSAECNALSSALGTEPLVRRISYPGASYAWDLPPFSGGEYSGQPWQGDNRTILVRSDPALAELSAAQVTEFIVGTLSGRSAWQNNSIGHRDVPR
jgi:dienelactone hydrolase